MAILALLFIAVPVSALVSRMLRRRPSFRPTLYLDLPDLGSPDFKGGAKNFAIDTELFLSPGITKGRLQIDTHGRNLVEPQRRDDG